MAEGLDAVENYAAGRSLTALKEAAEDAALAETLQISVPADANRYVGILAETAAG